MKPTLTLLAKENGYFVQGMGKLYHAALSHPGLDDPPSWSVPWTSPMARFNTYGLPENIANAKAGRKNGPAFECSEVPDNAFAEGQLAEMAVKALDECAERKQPFWLGVGFVRPHLPFISPKKYWDLYDPAKIELAPNPFRPKGAPAYAVGPGGELRAYQGIPGGAIPDDLARQLKHGYFAAISYTDAQVGKILDELDRLQLTDKTIIVVWGDNGWKLGEHAGWSKHTNMENDTHVPLIISIPGMRTAGMKTASLAELVDVYPTLADACALPLPKHLEGTSLLPVLRDTSHKVKSAAFSQFDRSVDGKPPLMGYSMRTDRYRLTRWVHRGDHSKVDAVELYDEQADPQENTNIADAPENAELVSRLTRQWLDGWQGAKSED